MKNPPPPKRRENMKCILCDRFINDIDTAIDTDWTPNFWCGEQEYGPTCPHCTGKYLEYSSDGEFQLKAIFERTFLDSASSKRFNMVLANVPGVSIYPDRELIKKLRGKFLEYTVDALSKDELIDLINHQNQLILDLDREIEEISRDF
jgi:hypothetical protein